MNLDQYIVSYYDGKADWFVEETNQVYNHQRINSVLDLREYIDGSHRINNQNVEIYNGKEYKPKGVMVDYMNLVIDFHTNYLLRNTPTLASSSEDVTNKFKTVYDAGFYEDTDTRLLGDLIKYGNGFEYVYLDSEKTIKSKIIPPEDAYPIYSPVTSEMIGFIEHYTIDNVSYWNVYDGEKVTTYSNLGGSMRLVGEYNSPTGLPIHYKGNNELDHTYGKSELIKLIPLLDDYESNVSKFSDTFYKHHNPILFTYGARTDEYNMFPSIVGQGVSMDLDSKAEMLSPKLDYQSFKELMGKLFIDFITIAGIPSVAINHSTISNVSTEAISMMFEGAENIAATHIKQLKRGFIQRWKKIRSLLEAKGINIDNEGFQKLNIVFVTAKPSNSTEIINNMVALKGINGISAETIIENSPFSVDKELERKRLIDEGILKSEQFTLNR